MIEHAPETWAGHAATSIACSAGLWRWGALGGLGGLDWQAAHLMHDDKDTWPEVREALRLYEGGAVEGAADRARKEEKHG